MTAAADNAEAAATVTSLSAFLAVPDSSDDAGLSPPDWAACNYTQNLESTVSLQTTALHSVAPPLQQVNKNQLTANANTKRRYHNNHCMQQLLILCPHHQSSAHQC